MLGLSIVAEFGTGRRSDATTAIPDDATAVSSLTNVDVDRQGSLGNAVAEILREEVGIARRGKLLVLGGCREPRAGGLYIRGPV